MPRHEFGIVPQKPKAHKRYDQYAPDKYACISVDDAWIREIAGELSNAAVYWHTLACPANAYCGITLIPPTAMDDMRMAVDHHDNLQKFENAFPGDEAAKQCCNLLLYRQIFMECRRNC